MRKLVILLGLLAAVLLLSACGNNDYKPTDLTAKGAIGNLSCDDATSAFEMLDAAAKDGDTTTLDDFGITGENQDQLSKDLKAHKDQVCALPGSKEEPQSDIKQVNDQTATVASVAGGPQVNIDSRVDQRTPPVVPDVDMANLKSWKDLFDKMKDQQWYIDSANERRPVTGWGWNEVKLWANVRTADGKIPDARVIKVYSLSAEEVSDEEARRVAHEKLGGDWKEFEKMPVERHGHFMNTRGHKQKQLSNFEDKKRQIRVTLVPLVLNADGSLAGKQQNANSGVFVDCLNIWWLYFQSVPKGTPMVCPPNSAYPGKPMTSVRDCLPPGEQPPPDSQCKVNCNPTDKCPPGNTNPDCSPKSGNAADYQVPAGKPKAGAPSGNAQGSAQDPAQNDSGGRGDTVTDNPGNSLGSESGGTVPGAETPNEQPPPTGDGQGEDAEEEIDQPDW